MEKSKIGLMYFLNRGNLRIYRKNSPSVSLIQETYTHEQHLRNLNHIHTVAFIITCSIFVSELYMD